MKIYDTRKLFFFRGYGDHRDLHVLTHSFPTRRSADLYGGPAADVDDQPVVGRGRQRMRDPRENQPGFFAARDDFDRETQGGFGPGEQVFDVDRKSTRLKSSH